MSKIINLYGGPGVGKSTIAAGLFYKMKTSNYSVELVTEYAKELVYDKRNNVLDSRQFYIFAKQLNKIQRLIENKIEWIITDSPLLLSLIYDNGNYPSFAKLAKEVYYSQNNYNVYLERNELNEYQSYGRLQSSCEESIEIDNKIINMLTEMVEESFWFTFTRLPSNLETIDILYKFVKSIT